jgi:predicted dehydrogenase
MVLPGVGIFGCEPIARVLIQLLQHFGFEIHAIWTNNYEMNLNRTNDHTENASHEINKNILTTSIDSVLLNKNVALVFVCCQPSLHAQICSKALGNCKKLFIIK